MRPELLAALFWLYAASSAHANVLEISDDGDVRLLTEAITSLQIDDNLNPAGKQALREDPFEHAARRHRIDPNLLRAVAWTESRGNNDAVSPKGARGIMQLMPATAARLGVDPSDPAANIDGGAAYLAQQMTTFHDVPLALAAYNAGPGAVIRYGGIPPYAETRGYVTKVMGRWRPIAAATPGTLPSGPVALDAGAIAPPVQSLPVLLIEVPE